MIAIIKDKIDNECQHSNRHYQPREYDTNVAESYTCEDCGAELALPDPDWDIINKEKKYG